LGDATEAGALEEIVIPVVSLDLLASAASLMDGSPEEETKAANGVELTIVSEAADYSYAGRACMVPACAFSSLAERDSSGGCSSRD
jgi:hypothetical protein